MRLIDEEAGAPILRDPQTEPELLAAAFRLVQRAATLGLVLTIEQVSLPPLAMGNYATEVSTRKARWAQ